MLGEAVQIDGGVAVLFFLVVLALFLGFVGLCWVAYRAGTGNRLAQVVVGFAALYLLTVLISSGGLDIALWTVTPLVVLAICAGVGRARSRR